MDINGEFSVTLRSGASIVVVRNSIFGLSSQYVGNYTHQQMLDIEYHIFLEYLMMDLLLFLD